MIAFQPSRNSLCLRRLRTVTRVRPNLPNTLPVRRLSVFKYSFRYGKKTDFANTTLHIASILALLLFTTSVNAQSPLREPTAWRVGVFGGYGFNYHQARTDALPGIETNPFYDTLYQGSIGLGASAGAFFEKPLSHTFSLAARLSFSQLSTTFRSQTVLLQRPNGVDIEGATENALAVNLTTITADPLIAWHPFFGASVYAGLRLGASFGTSSLTRTVIDPTGELTLFEDNQRTRTEFRDSALNNLFFPQISATAGISYAIALNPQETLFLAPEVWYTHGFTPQVREWNPNNSGSNNGENFWNVHQLRGGLSFRYSPEAPRIFMPPAIMRTAETKQLAINITPVAVDSVGGETPLLRLTVEEIPSRQMHPVLPFIFFDRNADSIPNRYIRLQARETTGFSEEKFSRLGTLEIYYHLLNILGKRMKSRPEATVRLVGTLADDEQAAGIDLASRRAEAVMMYLRDVWRIQPDRITIESRINPTKPTAVFQKQGGQMMLNEEHRRVELYSDDWELLQPLVFTDTLREASPPSVKFFLQAETRTPLQRWAMTIEQSKQMIWSVNGTGVNPPAELVWNPSRQQGTIPRTENVVRCNFDFVEQSGEGATATVSFPVEQITLAEKFRRGEQTRSTDVYRILNDDIDNSNTQAKSPSDIERILKLIAAQRFLARATVTATGYNDKVLDTYGNAAQNLALAKERATAVAKALANVISPGNHIPRAIPQARGGKVSIYPEFTPEGRMYSRMVELRVDTPKE